MNAPKGHMGMDEFPGSSSQLPDLPRLHLSHNDTPDAPFLVRRALRASSYASGVPSAATRSRTLSPRENLRKIGKTKLPDSQLPPTIESA